MQFQKIAGSLRTGKRQVPLFYRGRRNHLVGGKQKTFRSGIGRGEIKTGDTASSKASPGVWRRRGKRAGEGNAARHRRGSPRFAPRPLCRLETSGRLRVQRDTRPVGFPD